MVNEYLTWTLLPPALRLKYRLVDVKLRANFFPPPPPPLDDMIIIFEMFWKNLYFAKIDDKY